MAVRHLKGHVSWVQTVSPKGLGGYAEQSALAKLTHIGETLSKFKPVFEGQFRGKLFAQIFGF